MKCELLVLVAFLANALALECYVSDLEALESTRTAPPKTEQCRDFHRELVANSSIRYFCYTTTADLHGHLTFTLQGCVADDVNCEYLKKKVKFLEPYYKIHLRNIHCRLCSQDLCNSEEPAVTPSNVYIYVSVACIVGCALVAAVIVAAKCYFVKSKTYSNLKDEVVSL